MTEKFQFQWDDPLLLEDELSADDKMIRDTARTFATERLLPGIVHANRYGSFDIDILRDMGSLGLLGPTLEGYGCAGR